MKKIVIVISVLMLIASTSLAQEKIKTKTGTITFEASVPSFEEVKATNENVSAILNTESGEFAALALMKGFRFKIALMEEHFNENYAESSVYPKSVFKGKIKNFSLESISETPLDILIIGSVSMHGETKEIEVPAQLWREDNSIILSTSFSLKPEDFNIKIPGVVSKKIAEEVEVSARFSLIK